MVKLEISCNILNTLKTLQDELFLPPVMKKVPVYVTNSTMLSYLNGYSTML